MMKSQAASSSGSKIDLTWASENQTVWIMLPEDDPSGEACKKGVITKLIDDENVEVKAEDAQAPSVLKGDKVYPLNNYRDYPEGYDDMVDMEYLSEAELLNNLRIRFQLDMIYTYVGSSLIVLNPYKRIDKLLVPTIMKKFQDSLVEGKFEQKEHMPHVYAIAATTMRNLFENKKNQAIVISGESGAGKTENTKSAMKFLTSLGKPVDGPAHTGEENIEDKILACNPVLEAFGNAKTVRNDNSSRFGKYVALLVEKDTKKIVGATITNYLLEKSRVVSQNSEERNYHIFYAFLRGASEETLKTYYLTKNLDDWNFLKNAFKGVVRTVPDPELYQEVVDSFNTMKFTETEQRTVWIYTAASLMVGNLDFDESGYDDKTPCKLKNEEYLKNAAELLNVDFERFSKSLRYKTRVVGTDTIDSTIKKDECIMFRDSLAKDLFNKLFNWLVRRLNFTVMPPQFTKGGIDMNALMNKYYHIGLLDIFGFEIFNFNSLEQFCINFANEKLQQLYIAYVFKGEEKEFINEGLKEYLCELNFKDNQGLIDMLDSMKLPGIFQMIDESCSVNATDQNLYDKIIKQFKKPEFPLTTQKIARDTFIVKHTAKEVEYNINGFRMKNKDEISKTIEDAICSSSSIDVVRVWRNLCLDEVESEEAKNAKPNPKDKFLGYKFRSQMKDLMEELNSCECHFIRCLKPNEKKQSDFFLPQLVLQQIKYMGVLDTIKVRKDSFPVRTVYKNFYEKYQELDKRNSKIPFEKHVENGTDFKELARGICQAKFSEHLTAKRILFGNNKMFLRVEAAKEIEKMRRDLINKKNIAAKKFQRAWFYYKYNRIWKSMLKGIRALQKAFRISKEYLKFGKQRRKARQIQAWWRRILHKKRVAKLTKVSIEIQSWWKMIFYRNKYNKIKTGAKTINRLIRGGLIRKKARVLKKCRAIVEEIVNRGATALFEKVRISAAIVVQKYGRGYICRKTFKKYVDQIKFAKENFVKNKMIKTIQRHVRGFVVRSSTKRLHRAASFIQGHMRMRWLSALFQRLRQVSVSIQKSVRRWLIMRKVVKERMLEFKGSVGKKYKTLQIAEQANFFGFPNISRTGGTCNKEDVANFSKLISKNHIEDSKHFVGGHPVIVNQDTDSILLNETAKLHEDGIHIDSKDFNQDFSLNPTKTVDPYSSKKVNLFTKIIDIDVLCDTSLIYDPIWSLQALKLQNESYATGGDLQLIEVGQAHTLAIPSTGKVYSYGWNDCFQLGRPTDRGDTSYCDQINFSIDNFRPKSVAAGDDHNLLLDYQGNLYIWGDNSKAQLGLGHSREVSRITVLDFSSNDPLQEIRAKGNNSLAVTQSGKVFYWPVRLSSGQEVYKPAELWFPPKIQISTTACGNNFAVLISKNGLVFTFGRDNQAGQLGLGDRKPRDTPVLVESLKNEGELIVSASCGYKHVVCKSKAGKVYTWGWGMKGQLGHGELEDELTPRLVNLGQIGAKAKALQVQAGYSHSMAVLDNKKLLWWGTNASLDCQALPIEVDLQKKIADYHKEFTPIKVLCAWSKTMNITYVTIADTRVAELNPTTKNKVLSTLTNKIEENNAFNDVDPPFIESIAKYFPLKTMKDRSVKESKLNKTYAVGRKSMQLSKPIEFGVTPHYYESLAVMRGSPRNKEASPYETSQYSSLQKSPRSPDSNKPLKLEEAKQINKPAHKSLKMIQPILSSRLSSSNSTQVLGYQSQKNKSINPEERRTSETPKATTPRKSITKSPEKKPNMQNDEEYDTDLVSQKLVEIKRKMQAIIALPMDKWSATDAEFIKAASEPRLLALLQKIQI